MLADKSDDSGDENGDRKVVPFRSTSSIRRKPSPGTRTTEFAPLDVKRRLNRLELPKRLFNNLERGWRQVQYSVELREVGTRTDRRRVHVAVGQGGELIYLIHIDREVLNELDRRYLKNHQIELTYIGTLFPRDSRILVFSEEHQALEHEYEKVLENWRDERRYGEFIAWNNITALKRSKDRIDVMRRMLRKAKIVTEEGEKLPVSDSHPQKYRVFISYSHEDVKWLNRLTKHLDPLRRDGLLDVWDDRRIRPGEDWRKKIAEALNSTRIAVLLVSADFLASDFVRQEELPKLLAAEEPSTIIMSIIVAPCRFNETPSLSRFQAVNRPNRPLSKMSKNDQEEIFLRVANEIDYAIGRRL